MVGRGAELRLGKRRGELLSCTRLRNGSDCGGVSHHCLTCGAAVRISATGEHREQSVRQYRLSYSTRFGEETIMDLEISSTPIQVEGRTFAIFAVQESGLVRDPHHETGESLDEGFPQD